MELRHAGTSGPSRSAHGVTSRGGPRSWSPSRKRQPRVLGSSASRRRNQRARANPRRHRRDLRVRPAAIPSLEVPRAVVSRGADPCAAVVRARVRGPDAVTTGHKKLAGARCPRHHDAGRGGAWSGWDPGASEVTSHFQDCLASQGFCVITPPGFSEWYGRRASPLVCSFRCA